MVNFELLCETFDDLTKAPDKFLSGGLLSGELKNLLKNAYDFGQNHVRISKNALPELIVKDFDDEQIWQELELQNEDCLPSLINKAARLLVSKKLVFPVKGDAENADEDKNRLKKVKEKVVKKKEVAKRSEAVSSEEETDEEEYNENDDDIWSDNDENLNGNEKPRKVKIIPSEVDDNFFKLSEMEAFLKDQEEKGDNLGSGIDFFGDVLSDSEDEDDRPMYNDFFHGQNDNNTGGFDEQDQEDESGEDVPNEEEDYENQEDFDDDELGLDNANNSKSVGGETSKKVKFNLQSDSESDYSSDDNKVKSSFEIRQERLRKKINELEEEALQEKAWPLKGEVSASVRPINSLLEEVVEFDTAQRPPPIVTEETTNRLEDIIKQRIRDQAYDDVERKIKPVTTPNEFKKKLVLDQEKSKLSLAEVYEQEYLKQKVDQNQGAVEKPEVEPEEHQIIKKMMASLFTKLDALSNFFFVPKPVAPNLKVVSNLPAVEMEEVAPVSVSSSQLLAPEEVGGTFKRSLLAKEEKTKTDQKRERRKKKALQAKKFKAKALKDANKPASYNEELKKVMKFKNVSKLEEKSSNSFNTSKDFFSKLQDEVQNPMSQKDILKKRKSKQSTKSAKKLKL